MRGERSVVVFTLVDLMTHGLV